MKKGKIKALSSAAGDRSCGDLLLCNNPAITFILRRSGFYPVGTRIDSWQLMQLKRS